MKICILYSGGLDSFLLYRWALTQVSANEVVCVYFDIGQPYVEKEVAATKQLGVPTDYRRVDWLANGGITNNPNSSSGNIMIPGRNLALVTLAACIYRPHHIWLGALEGETHDKAHDKNYPFLMLTNEVLQYVFSTYGDPAETPRLGFPFADMKWSKLDLVREMLQRGLATQEEVLITSSCLNGGVAKNCGECVVCLRRWGIFRQLGFSEPYAVHPLASEANRKVVVEMASASSYYDKKRSDEVLPAVLDLLGLPSDCPKVILERALTWAVQQQFQ